MHPADIKAELQKRGMPCAEIARRLDVKRGSVSEVVNGNASSRRIAFEISRVLGKPAHVIWPGKYSVKVARAAQRRAIKRAVRPKK